MGSIRPLFTITVLVVVGAYLYAKINEGPVRPHAGAQGASGQSQDGVPPLAAAGGGATLAHDNTAPAWPAVDSKAPAMSSPSGIPAMRAAGSNTADVGARQTAGTDDPAKNGPLEVPPIPDLPELPKTADTNPPTAPIVAPPTELPKNVPAANYGEEAGPKLGGSSPDVPGALPALPTIPGANTAADGASLPTAVPGAAVPAATAAALTYPTANAALPVTPSVGAAPPAMDRYGAPLAPNTRLAAPVTTPMTPVPNAPAAMQSAGRYGAGGSAMPESPVTSPLSAQPPAAAGVSFAASWPAIQAALDRRDLKQAHQLLSKWHGDESLSPAEAQKVESLLGELAGTVIYSTEHQLEPARVVKPGETLETIAKEYNVTWQLLAKINSIPAPDQVRPGQELKVVRGPFSAVVDLHRNELTLEVDGRYAGTFPVTVPPGAPVAEGQWLVDKKLDGAAGVQQAVYAAPLAPNDRTIVLRAAPGGGAAPSTTLTIASNPPAGATAGAALKVAPQDAEDLSDILSVGSRVIVRR